MRLVTENKTRNLSKKLLLINIYKLTTWNVKISMNREEFSTK